MALPNFNQIKVLVVGDVMLDRYWSGATARVSPEAPVPVVNINNAEDRPGGAANVAINLSSLGARVTLLGMVGNDANADALEKRLLGYGIECHFCRCEGYDTITKLRVMSRNQQLLRMDFERSFSAVDKTPLETQFTEALASHDLVILSDYAKGALSNPQQLIAQARCAGTPVVVDPKGADFTKYRGATLITPNMAEFSTVMGEVNSEQQLVEQANKLCADLELAALLVTRSEQGMTLFTPGEPEFHLPAKAKEVYDVTGAGDTVISTLAACMAAGESMQQACVMANLAASIVVGKLGTSTVTTTELAVAAGQHSHPDGGVMSEEQLMLAVSAAKQRGEKVVMTNGCFDILHAGHVSYLDAASKLGDRLIVAVNTDASVQALKGPGRPVNPVQRRMAVLAGLSAVDWVVPFSEETPQRLIAGILPDVLVKGGDYKVEDIAGGQEVLDNGGVVKVLHFEEGVSTTGIIETIVKHQSYGQS
ncbi:bifunctional D-glycero-beta-D-manno-heptose-7-phosphate kinase/D-glycero-beta-D-manno-heptose 1-phosphate adenylyltransferase HldE [Alteromonas lipolytica]|uniref:Bifunctional protein HldE n=1 Tax=Alteromonas lipolytica TaxID=1856405 RepID=A0A1E8FDN1_9ALTE|nr:bifunctional D-glycero-beta-D-manno-heptose-7-phosphate kinase/D-glycero-beta-D-manno-heptose 1-phosphate adenylyltransferase HldE [Alteromonas lipolytica]OFI34042.1 bifunctional heptose 7-phosphate kinase/heptose 1-phosphate adenyltransferase [Alteromonas lipolytica]GGF65959.1 bifunctional protein HldE [Alteromonas lipolytica]